MRTSQHGPTGHVHPVPWRRWLLPAAVTASFVTLLVLPGGAAPGTALSYTRFMADVGAGTVRAVTIGPGGQVTGMLAGGQPFTTTIPVALGGNGLAGDLAAHHVQVTATAAMPSSLPAVLTGLLPLLLLTAALLFFAVRNARQQAGALGGMGGVTKAKTQVIDAERPWPWWPRPRAGRGCSARLNGPPPGRYGAGAGCSAATGDPRQTIRVWTERLGSLRLSPAGWMTVTGLALANWLTDAGVLAVSIHAAGAAVPWHLLLLVYGSGIAAQSLNITPGGLGAAEGALGLALVATGLHAGQALAAVLLYRLASFWLAAFAGWLVLLWLRHARATPAPAPRKRCHPPAMTVQAVRSGRPPTSGQQAAIHIILPGAALLEQNT